MFNYITDEGVSGGKDPDKRNLGPLLKQIKKGDVIICSEISRLGRDLYMVMDILHFCMEQGCIIYTVKDKFVLGDDIQSKVLAFAFGLSAEIERQMIRQRTKEGLRLRMKLGILVGRPIGRLSDSVKLDPVKEQVIEQYNWGVPLRRLAKNFNVDRNTLSRTLGRWGVMKTKEWVKNEREIRRAQSRRYKDEPYKVVELNRDICRELILNDYTIPEIAESFPGYSYEQVYDTILCDAEFNPLYREHGQIKIKKRR